MADVLERARVELRGIVIGETEAHAAELDLQPNAELYAVKTWKALRALDAYASARSSRQFSGSFYNWCDRGATNDLVISLNSLAMTESESVNNNEQLRACRVFRVPRELEVDGVAFMPAHVKIGRKGWPAPRLHFLDDSGGLTGKVHVGYIGEHLPTARYAH